MKPEILTKCQESQKKIRRLVWGFSPSKNKECWFYLDFFYMPVLTEIMSLFVHLNKIMKSKNQHRCLITSCWDITWLENRFYSFSVHVPTPLHGQLAMVSNLQGNRKNNFWQKCSTSRFTLLPGATPPASWRNRAWIMQIQCKQTPKCLAGEKLYSENDGFREGKNAGLAVQHWIMFLLNGDLITVI